MSEQRIEAIVLKQQDYRENDALITVLSPRQGKLSFVCRGIRKMASRNAVSCMPFVRCELQYQQQQQKTLFSLKSARPLASYWHIRQDLTKLAIAQVMTEIADKILPGGQEDLAAAQAVYDLLDTSLQRLDGDAFHELVLCQYLAGILKVEGIEPLVDECVLCGSRRVQTISVEEGGFLCARCAGAMGAHSVGVAELKKFRLINKAAPEHYSLLQQYGPWTKKDAEFLIRFLIVHTGLQLESWRFLDRCSH